MPKFLVILLQKLRVLSSLSIRLTKLTGKSKEAIHPKHLINPDPWFLKYLSKNDSVLDIGCGNGQNSLKVARLVKQIFGIDLDKKELDKGKREAERRRIKNIEFFQVSAEERLKFSGNFFDKILFFDVLEHIENQDLALKEVWRVLKRGGLVLLSVPNKNTSWKRLQRSLGLDYFSDPDHKREYSEAEIRGLLSKQKFKILTISPVVFDTPLAPVFDLVGGFSLSLYSKLAAWKKRKAIQNPAESTGFEIIAQKA